jgi:hypothetical protein
MPSGFSEQLAMLIKEQKKDEVKPEAAKTDKWNPGTPPISVISSRKLVGKRKLDSRG